MAGCCLPSTQMGKPATCLRKYGSFGEGLNSSICMNLICNICQAPTTEFASMLVRGKYDALLLRCSNCGFMFVPDPIWLGEAYAEPINRSDTGYCSRHLWARDKMRECIESNLNPDGIFLDYAAGYGLFVRLMRDAAY